MNKDEQKISTYECDKNVERALDDLANKAAKGKIPVADKKAIANLAVEKEQYIDRISEIDKKIIAIQKSTRTAIPFLASLHNALRMRFKWYYNWHLNPYANAIHIVLVILTLIWSVIFVTIQIKGWEKPATAAKGTTLIAKDDSGVFEPSEKETEIIAERSENFKKFKKIENGKEIFRVAGGIAPIHYKDDPFNESEEFKEIDLTIKDHQKSDGDDWDFEVTENGYQVKIWNSRSVQGEDVRYVAQFTRAGKFLEMAPSELVWENSAGDREVISVPLDVGAPEIDNDNYTVTWRSVFGQGIDFRYNIAPDKFFKTVIINSKSDLPAPTINQEGLKLKVVMAVRWDASIKTSNSFAPDFETEDILSENQSELLLKDKSKKEKTKSRGDLKDFDESKKDPGKFSFKDDSNRDVWWINEPVAWDSAERQNQFALDDQFSRIGNRVYNELALSKEKIDDAKTQFPIFIDTAITEEQVPSENDDAYYCVDVYDGATWTNSNTYMYAGNTICDYWENSGRAPYSSWVRYTSVPIPQGATIDSASLTVKALTSLSGTTANFKIRAQDEDNATQLASAAAYEAVTWTTAQTNWSSVSSFTANSTYQSSDIKSVVQEVTDRASWSNNNAMGFQIADNSSSTDAYRDFYGYSGGAANTVKFNASYTAAGGTITVSGTCKQYDRSANCADSEVVKVAIDGSVQAQTGSTSSGTWSISGVSAPTTGQTITVFTDGVADSAEANAVTKYDGSGDITGVTLYERHLTIGSADNQTLSNADSDNYDNSISADEDIFFEIDASNDLTLPAASTQTATDQVLYILASNTYRPDSVTGQTITVPNLNIPTSATLTADANTFILTASGTPFTKAGTFTYNTSVFRYTGAGNTTITAADYYTLETKPSAETGASGWVVSGATNSPTYNGTYTASGTFNGQTSYTNGSRWLYYAQHNVPTPGYKWVLYTSTSNFMDYLSAAYSSLTSLPGNPWSLGTAGTNPVPSVAAASAGYTYTFASGTMNVYGNFVNGDGTNDVSTTVDTNDPTFNIDGTFTNSADGTFIASASATFSVGGNFTNNSTSTFTSSSGTLTLDGTGTQSITSAGDSFGTITVSNTSAEVSQADAATITTLNVNTNAIYDINGQNITLTTLSNDGTFRMQNGETTVTITNKDTNTGTIEYDGSATYSSWKYGNTYYSLKISGSGTFNLGASVTINGNFTQSAGTYGAGNNAYTTTITGSFNMSGGSFTIPAQGGYRTKLTAGSFSKNNGTFTNGDFSTTDINGSFTNSGGGIVNNANAYLYISGDYSFTSGTITGSSTCRFYFDGNANAAINNSSASFIGTFYSAKGATYTLTLNADIAVTSFSNSGLINTNGRTITFNYDNGSFVGGGATYDNITVAANPLYLNSNATINGTMTVNTAKAANFGSEGMSLTFSDTGRLVLAAANSSFSSGVYGSYFLFKDDAATNFPTTGTANGKVRLEAATKNITAPARTYGGSVGFYNNGASDRTATLGTAGSQTLAFSSDVTVNTTGAGALTIQGSTWNPIVNITGNTSITKTSTGVPSITFGTGLWSAAGNFNLTNGTITSTGSTLRLNGSGAQTLTSASQSFNNLTVTNASASGVTFADNCTVAGTFTATTASTKLTFDALSTYAFANININGQASGTKITMNSNDTANPSLPSRQFYFNVSQASPSVSYVTVTNSDALGGNPITPIGSTDGGNNENWNFNTAPANDSLTFTNPYTSNHAIADDTTSWNFRVLATDTNGSTDFDYVELRLANSADSAQPYDSLKFRWTQATDTFSEQADTQNSATLTSTATDSNASGNQWTLDFKFKLNNSFLAKDTNYYAEVYTIDDASATDTDNYVNVFQVRALSLSLNLDSNTLAFGSLLPGSVITGTTVATVTTNYPNGYTLSAHDSVAGSDSVLLHTDTSTRIADYAGTIGTPTLWSGTGLGICLYSATNKESKWGTGTTADDANNKYAGIPQNATEIHAKTGAPTSSDANSIGYKLVVPNTQKTGSYSGILTYTATGTLL